MGAKLPDFKRIAKEDFPQEYHDLIDKIAFPLNSHMEQVRNLFNKNIDFNNLARELIPLRVQTGDTSAPLAKLTFKSNLNNKIRGLNVISASVVTPVGTYLNTAPFISFSQEGSIVTITNISGLSQNTTYDLLLETIS